MPTPEFTITKCPAFMLPDGNRYATIQIAQRAALLKLLTPADMTDAHHEELQKTLEAIFNNLDHVKAILGATGRRPRKAKGNGKARRTPTVRVSAHNREGRPE